MAGSPNSPRSASRFFSQYRLSRAISRRLRSKSTFPSPALAAASVRISWGKPIFFAILIIAVILFFGWYLKISAQQEELETARQQEVTLKKDFSDKQAKVVNLEAYRKQLADMQEMLQTMLRQLPSKTEMPELLNNITQAALSAGIETELFQPGAETMKDFYAEKPIQLRMLGTYPQGLARG